MKASGLFFNNASNAHNYKKGAWLTQVNMH